MQHFVKDFLEHFYFIYVLELYLAAPKTTMNEILTNYVNLKCMQQTSKITYQDFVQKMQQ